MSLRDIFLFGVLVWLIFRIPRDPFIGALAWVVFGLMNPHRLAWGPAYSFPFSQAIAILTMFGLLITQQHRQPKGGAAAILMMVVLAWNGVTTVFAFNPADSQEYLVRILKVYLMTWVLLLLIHGRKQIDQLIWCIVLSLGFYGFKGGLFVLATGGSYMVNGPPDTVMEGNNSLGVGLVVTIPLLYYLFRQTQAKWLRMLLGLAMALCSVAVLGSYSRGALLAIFSMGLLFWLRSHNKLIILAGFIAFIMVAIPAMPDRWTDRMNTLFTYDQEASAVGRLVAWETAYNIAKDRFPLAGGLEWQSPATSARYSPDGVTTLVAHSIYFQVLGSSGFIGLGLLLTFWILVLARLAKIRKQAALSPDHAWAMLLASMIQASLVGYFVGGAFLDLAYWDLPYYLYGAVCGLYMCVIATPTPAAAAAAAVHPQSGPMSRQT